MTADRFEWNMPGLIELSNDVLEADCVPLAGQVEQAAQAIAPEVSGDYKNSIHVEIDPRTGEDDFGHAYVVADDTKAAIIESRRGVLARALNSVEG